MSPSRPDTDVERKVHVKASKPPLAMMLTGTALLLAACGASTATRSTTSAAGASAGAGRDVVRNRLITHRPIFGTGGAAHSKEYPGRTAGGRGARTPQGAPCTLVSRAEAQAILGARIAPPQQAPLGPTCIYQPLHGGSPVTLAIEAIDFGRLRGQISHLSRLAVRGRSAYCGDYGRPTVFVPLAGTTVLDITAPCGIGAQFAAKAIPRLTA
jgi:hypothetical protein